MLQNLAAQPTPHRELAARMMPTVRRLAGHLARRLPGHVSIDDLVSAGSQGLADAILRYDPSRAEGFTAYAERRIRGAMLDELRAVDLLSRDQRAHVTRLGRASRLLANRLGRAPSADELAAELGISLETCFEWQRAAATRIASVPEGEEEGDFFGQIGDADAEPADERVHREQRAVATRRAMAQIPPRLAQVLELHYVEGLTLRQIGAQFGVSESRVCQLASEAIRRLRDLCSEEPARAAA